MGEIRTLAPDEFPRLLKEIPDAPRSLYVRGVLPPPTHTLLAVVGSRRMTRYGKDACEHLISGLRGFPISIVSGLALGIDGVAHQSALATGLHTVAVPGSGLDDSVLYPSTHRRLAHEILNAGGTLLSEEEPDFKARPESFPKRNRIMAGMCHAVLVVEAGLQSGTLITARLAIEYNRDVLTVPGSIFSENTEGPHLLLSLGATPIRNASDVLTALGFEQGATTVEVNLSPEELAVFELLHEPHSRDELVRALSFPTAHTNTLLIRLELRGIIREEGGMLRRTGS